jgi:hypothetical protein
MPAYIGAAAGSSLLANGADRLHQPERFSAMKTIRDESAPINDRVDALNRVQSMPPPISQIPSVVDRWSSNAPASSKVMAESSNFLGNWLGADSNIALTANPSIVKPLAKYIAPFVSGVSAIGRIRSGENPFTAVAGAAKDVYTGVAPYVAPGAIAGTIMKRLPGLSSIPAPTPGAILRGGAIVAGADILNNAAQHVTGLAAPTDFAEAANEAWWKPQVRSLTNIGVGAGAGFLAGKNPITAVGGALFGAVKEPIAQHQRLTEMNRRGDEIKAWANDSILDNLSNPRIPLTRFGDKPSQISLSGIPKQEIEQAIAARRQYAGEMGLADKVRQEGEAGDFARAGATGVQAQHHVDSVRPHLEIGGKILAAGAGLYLIRKFFEKRKKEKDQEIRTLGDRMVPKIASAIEFAMEHSRKTGMLLCFSESGVIIPKWSK